jgi:hypothetical protein
MSTLKLIDSLVNLDSKIERGVSDAEDWAAKRETVIGFMVLAVLVMFILWVVNY